MKYAPFWIILMALIVLTRGEILGSIARGVIVILAIGFCLKFLIWWIKQATEHGGWPV